MKPLDEAINAALAKAGIDAVYSVSSVLCVVTDDTGKQTLLTVDLADAPVTPAPPTPPAPPVTPPSKPSPTAPTPPATPAFNADSIGPPFVEPDGLSVLYHMPTGVNVQPLLDTTTIPGTFGGSPQTVLKIAWNFGDGTNGFGASGRHDYAKGGTYTLTGSISYKSGTLTPFGPLTVTVS